MTIFLGLIALLGILIGLVGSVWFLVNAFRTSVLWGIMCFLFTPAWIRFCFRHWDMARQPLCVLIVGAVMGFGAAHFLPEGKNIWGEKLPHRGGSSTADASPKHTLPPMFEAQKKMELQIRLAALQKREDDLLQRKAELDPKDRAAALALTEEIKKYNDDLRPVLQAMRDRGMVAAQ